MLPRTALLALAGCLAALLLFDVLAYFFAPASLTAFAPNYRAEPQRGSDMRGYHREDPVMGFDIAPNRRGHSQHVNGVGSVPASSNDLGCRDPRSLADIRALDDYVYFAGDSYTWGLVASDHSFPRVYERASGNPSLNCGVIATGQWHQLEKFRRTAAAIGHLPSRVVIGHFPNDLLDDFWYPTADTTTEPAKAVLRTQALGRTLAGKGPGNEGSVSWSPHGTTMHGHSGGQGANQEAGSILRSLYRKARPWLLQFSLAFHLLRAALREPAAPTHPLLTYKGQAKEALLDYRHSPYTQPHREALRAWAEHARKHGYELAVVLILHRGWWGNPTARAWRQGVKGHLDALSIPHWDFFSHVEERELRPPELFWEQDSHLNERGNQVLGEWLARELP